jgi:hypothetical protein
MGWVHRATLLGNLLRAAAAAPTAAAHDAPPHDKFLRVSGAGNATANGVYMAKSRTSSSSSYVAASGLQIFIFQDRWYLGESGTGPVLYEGACNSARPPLNWTRSQVSWGAGALPPPRITASTSLPAPAACAAPFEGYTLSGAGTAGVNGAYTQTGATSFRHTTNSSIQLYRRAEGQWVVSTEAASNSRSDSGAAAADLYVSNCPTSILPPANRGRSHVTTGNGWHTAAAGTDPTPLLSASVAFPLGYCAPVPPPQPTPHPRCSTKECDQIWGKLGCPDLNGIAPDLVRPKMVDGVPPAAGARVRAVAPGFENTLVYHPLYLPTEWSATRSKKFPVIVEYMGNGPFNDVSITFAHEHLSIL